METLFYFDPKTGTLLAAEMFPDRHSDPCEIYFRDYRKVSGRLVPHELEVHHGDSLFDVISIERVEFEQSPEDRT